MKEFAENLLKTNTGIHMLDSGGVYGRHWERNQALNFEDQPEVEVDPDHGSIICPIASLYHWLVSRFELDDLCKEFNALPVEDWESDLAYGLSLAGEKWLIDHGFEIMRSDNSYNYESDLSQVVQYCYLKKDGIETPYMLIQIHQGCDVRGGYTDAVLLKAYDLDYVSFTGNVMAVITTDQGIRVLCDNIYNGYCLTDENGANIIWQDGWKINAWIMDF